MTTKYHVVLLTVAALLLVGTAAALPQQHAPLTITNGPRIEYIGPRSAEIAWTTSTGGSSIIRYGTSQSSLNQTAEEAYQRGEGGHHVTHRVTIKGLQPNTTYFFLVDSGQGQGTGTEAKSPIQSFTTKPEGSGGGAGAAGAAAAGSHELQITHGPNVEYVGRDKAEIAWTTNTGASSIVRYGTSPNRLNETAESPYDRASAPGQHVTHRVTVKGLQPNTTYYFVVDSGQGQTAHGEAKSQVGQFKTKQ